MKLTDEQIDSIMERVHAFESAVRRFAEQMMAVISNDDAHPVADAAVAPQDAAEFAKLQTFLTAHHAGTRPAHPAGLAAWALAALTNARRAAFNEAASVDARTIAMLMATGKVSKEDVDAALEQVGKSVNLAAPTPTVAADAVAPGEAVFALQALVAAGHVTQAKVDEALQIARKTSDVAQPDERAECIEWANANGFPKYHDSMVAAWEERARRAASQATTKCPTCHDHGMIGGPSYYAPDEGGVPCPDCAAAPQAPEPYNWRDTGPLETEGES